METGEGIIVGEVETGYVCRQRGGKIEKDGVFVGVGGVEWGCCEVKWMNEWTKNCGGEWIRMWTEGWRVRTEDACTNVANGLLHVGILDKEGRRNMCVFRVEAHTRVYSLSGREVTLVNTW